MTFHICCRHCCGVTAEEGGGVGPTREELADAASDVAASILTGLSVYTDHTYAGTGVCPWYLKQLPQT